MQHRTIRNLAVNCRNKSIRNTSSLIYDASHLTSTRSSYMDQNFPAKVEKYVKQNQALYVLCDGERGTNPFAESIMRSKKFSNYHLIRINCKGLDTLNLTHAELYQELNRRITTNGVTLPNIADSYELERIFTEEECAYVLGGKKAVLLLDHVSALLNHPIEKISEHFQEVMNRLKIISTREKYYFQCFIGLDTVSKEEAVMNHFDEQLEEDQHNLPDPFYRMTFNR